MEWTFDHILGIAGFVLAVIALGATLAMDAKTRGELLFANSCFVISALMLMSSVGVWGLTTEASSARRIIVVAVSFALIGVSLVEALRWTQRRHEAARPSAKDSTSVPADPPTLLTPNLVFVFGVPLGDNDSASWMMMLRHFGPSPAYNCNIEFFDNDRKNLEHQWLVAHPDSPFPPPGLVGESQRHIYVPETGPEGSPGGFPWNPLDPDRQHYTVSISCRDGVFVETWEVTRVDGILRSKVTIEHGPQWVEQHPNADPVVFKCVDPEFMSKPLATEAPTFTSKRIVHPGWKPKHGFEVPAAIIDPNGHVQVVSGIKLPDGSTMTDFGCWNILTRHFKDNPDSVKQQ